MNWIKYQILQSIVDEVPILVDKKIGFSNENLVIARAEAYNGYEIVEDTETFENEPLGIEFGGTGAKTAEEARANLGFDAQNVSYDNSGSGLVSNNVQGAINEVNNKTGLIVVSNLSPQTEVLGTGQNPQSDGTFAPTIADGYKVLGVISTYPTGTGSSGVASFAYYDESDGLVHYRINNTRTTVAKITLNVRMLCQYE